MGVDVFGQFVEACVCLGVGVYFGVKIALTGIIGDCSGKILRFFLELYLGLSFVLYLYAVIFVMRDGNIKYYHYLIEIAGTLVALPVARKLLLRFKHPIQKCWLFLLGKNPEVDAKEPEIKPKRVKIKRGFAEGGEAETAAHNNEKKDKNTHRRTRRKMLKIAEDKPRSETIKGKAEQKINKKNKARKRIERTTEKDDRLQPKRKS